MSIADKLNKSCNEIFKQHSTQYFSEMKQINQNTENYRQKTEREYFKLCWMQKAKYWGIVVSSVLSPIAILLYLLEFAGVIDLLK